MVSAVFLARLVAARADRMVLVTSAVNLPLPLLRCLVTVKSGGRPAAPSSGGGVRGAPGPVAGAGLPFLCLFVGIAYVIVRRRRRTHHEQCQRISSIAVTEWLIGYLRTMKRSRLMTFKRLPA